MYNFKPSHLEVKYPEVPERLNNFFGDMTLWQFIKGYFNDKNNPQRIFFIKKIRSNIMRYIQKFKKENNSVYISDARYLVTAYHVHKYGAVPETSIQTYKDIKYLSFSRTTHDPSNLSYLRVQDPEWKDLREISDLPDYNSFVYVDRQTEFNVRPEIQIYMDLFDKSTDQVKSYIENGNIENIIEETGLSVRSE